MNLADAIRQAAYGGGPLVPETPQPAPLQVQQAEAPAPTPVAEIHQPAPKATKKAKRQEPEEAQEHAAMPQHTPVRMELFLSPEQLSALFKAVVNSQHTVMTLREAASYLRINAATLEQMAQHGDVAAFMVDSRWRFPKSGLDEWVALNTFRKEDADAA